MWGLTIYWFVGFGIGRVWAINERLSGMGAGACFLLGLISALILYPVIHIYFGVTLIFAAWILVVFAAFGWVVWAIKFKGFQWNQLVHPVLVLPFLSLMVILYQGYIDYLPYTNDEFSNWLDVPRQIYYEDGYASQREDVHLPGYTPGWRLWLTLPWFLLDRISPGDAATAPLLLHIGVLAIAFDICCRRSSRGPSSNVVLVSWTVVLLLAVSQAMGPLWIYTLLPEQPQVYLAVACLLMLLVADDLREIGRYRWWVAAGVICLGSYLLKSPGVLLACGGALAGIIYVALQKNKEAPPRWPVILAVAVPAFVMMFLWQGGVESSNCLSSPLKPILEGRIPVYAKAGWLDLLERYSWKILVYVYSYKLVLTLAAIPGWIWIGMKLRWSPIVVMGSFAGAYFLALYFFHLVCFGEGYFATLNSMERFTRVPLQAFQTIGLIGLSLCVLDFVERQFAGAFNHRGLKVAVVGVILTLMVWEVRGLVRTAADISYRSHQPFDPMIMESYRLARTMNTLAAAQPPRILLIDDRTMYVQTIKYAKFFARGGRRGVPEKRYIVDAIQLPISPDKLFLAMKDVDVIWPALQNPDTFGVVAKLARLACTNGATTFLLRVNNNFECRGKLPLTTTWSVADKD